MIWNGGSIEYAIVKHILGFFVFQFARLCLGWSKKNVAQKKEYGPAQKICGLAWPSKNAMQASPSSILWPQPKNGLNNKMG